MSKISYLGDIPGIVNLFHTEPLIWRLDYDKYESTLVKEFTLETFEDDLAEYLI